MPFTIGKASWGGSSHFDGKLDEIRLSSVARSEDWVAAQYASMTDSYVSFGSETANEGNDTSKGIAVYADSTNTPIYNRYTGSTFAGEGSTVSPGRYRIMQGASSPTRNEQIVVGIQNDGPVTSIMTEGGSWYESSISPLGTVSETFLVGRRCSI